MDKFDSFYIPSGMTTLEKILAISAVCLAILIAIIIATTVMFSTKYKRPDKKFLDKQDLNQRFLSLDYGNKMMFVLDSKRYSEAKKIRYSEYLASYSKQDAKRVDRFFVDSINGRLAVGDYMLVDAYYSKDRRKQPHKNLLITTNENGEKNTLDLIAYTLPNLTEYDWLAHKGKKRYGFMDYETYLLNFRMILSRSKQATFHLVELSSIHGEFYPYAFYRLMDKVCLSLKKNQYVVQIDDGRFMFIDLNKSNGREIRRFSSEFMKMCEGFIAFNSLKSELILSIGMTTWTSKTKIPPLRKFVDGATENAVNSYSSAAKRHFERMDQDELGKSARNEIRNSTNRILKNKTWRISYTPFFPTNISETESYSVDTYFMDMQTYGEIGINAEDFFYYVEQGGKFDEAIGEILRDVNYRVKKSKRPNLIVPIGEVTFNKLLEYFLEHPPTGFKLTLALIYTESTHINSDKFVEKIRKANEKDISVIVYFKRMDIPYIASEVLSSLNGFMISHDGGEQDDDVYLSRIKLYSLIEFLSAYDRPILLYGIKSLDEIQLACSKPVTSITCMDLENSSSWLETPTVEEVEEFRSYISPSPGERQIDKLARRKI